MVKISNYDFFKQYFVLITGMTIYNAVCASSTQLRVSKPTLRGIILEYGANECSIHEYYVSVNYGYVL